MALQLPRLQQSAPLVDENGLPTEAFHIWWNTFAANLEKAFDDLANNVAAIAAAQSAANAAQSTANTANTTANTAKTNDKISASATVPSTLLTATDAGTSASITVAAHTRIYGDSTTVTIGSPVTLTGLSYSTEYAVYYDDPTTSTTSPTYHTTTVLNQAMANYASGRHFVGQVTTPAAGGGSTSGGINPPQGSGPYP